MLPSEFNKQMTHQNVPLSVFCFLPYVLSLFTCVCTSNVVINEIHYDPDVKTEAVEFIELYNTETTHIDLSGWHFSDGISYAFPAGAIISARGYVIVAVSPIQLFAKWGGTRTGVSPNLIFGPFQGRLANIVSGNVENNSFKVIIHGFNSVHRVGRDRLSAHPNASQNSDGNNNE